MSYVEHELCEAVDVVALIYAKRQFNLALDGEQDTRVFPKDAVQVLSILYNANFDTVYAQVQDEIQYQYKSLNDKHFKELGSR